jgi:putative DNA methylase
VQVDWLKGHAVDDVPPGYLVPVAYLWTRTVTCKNPHCHATVPLLKQTWLCKKQDRYVALKVVAPKGKKQVHFEVFEARSEKALGFDPEAGSKGGNATCPFCGTVADAGYIQEMGKSRSVGSQLLCVVCRHPQRKGLRFITYDALPDKLLLAEETINARITQVCSASRLTTPEELIGTERPSPNARGLTAPTRHGLLHFSDLFNKRQLLSLLTQCQAVLRVADEMRAAGYDDHATRAVCAYLGILVDRMADRGSACCRWDPSGLR